MIPGLSGGTIALILMVYEKLITELAKIGAEIEAAGNTPGQGFTSFPGE